MYKKINKYNNLLTRLLSTSFKSQFINKPISLRCIGGSAISSAISKPSTCLIFGGVGIMEPSSESSKFRFLSVLVNTAAEDGLKKLFKVCCFLIIIKILNVQFN